MNERTNELWILSTEKTLIFQDGDQTMCPSLILLCMHRNPTYIYMFQMYSLHYRNDRNENFIWTQ